MADATPYQVRDPIAVIILDLGLINGLGLELRENIIAHLEHACACVAARILAGMNKFCRKRPGGEAWLKPALLAEKLATDGKKLKGYRGGGY